MLIIKCLIYSEVNKVLFDVTIVLIWFYYVLCFQSCFSSMPPKRVAPTIKDKSASPSEPSRKRSCIDTEDDNVNTAMDIYTSAPMRSFLGIPSASTPFGKPSGDTSNTSIPILGGTLTSTPFGGKPIGDTSNTSGTLMRFEYKPSEAE